MQIKTISTAAGVNEIDFGNDNSQSTAHFYWLKNLGDSILYVSANPNPIAEKDDVAELPAKGAVSVETDEGKIYVLGAGKVEIHRTDSKFCPFDWQSSGSGGGGGGSITVDSELSDTSTNPLQNKVTTAAINEVNSTVDALRDDVLANTAALETKSDINHIHDISASGNPVIMDNLQGGVPFSEMVVSGKNLLTYPYNETTKTVNGITFTDNGDGTITVNGTATANATFRIDKDFGFEKEGNYFLSGCPSGGGIDSFYINWFQNHTGVTIKNYNDYGSGIIIPYQHIFSENNSLAIAIIAGTTVNNLVFRPQLELGDTATEYEPPITGRGLTVNVSGKNLIPYPYNRASGTYNGIELIVHDDGRFDMSGTATASFAILVFANGDNPIYLSGGQTYTISCNTPYDFSKFNLSARIYRADGNYTPIIKFPTTFVAKEGEYLTSALWIDSDVSVSAKNVELQLEYGDTATDYEPYHSSITTISPTSNPYTIPDSIGQQEGLNVVSVSEGEISVIGVQKNAAIKRIWDKFASTANEISGLSSEIHALEGTTSSSIEANAQEIEAVRNTLSNTNEMVHEANNSIEANAQGIEAVRNTLSDLDTTVNTTLSAEIETLKNENQALHTEIAELRALIETT